MMSLREEFIKLTPKDRIYDLEKPVIALTGGIATGKSTVTRIFKNKGIKVIDADELVKSIYEEEETKEFIRMNYPTAMIQDEISFTKLRELFFESSETKRTIESYIYQRLPQAFKEATLTMSSQNFYLYDIPLLYEKGLENLFDLSLVVYAPRKTQFERLMSRDKTKGEIAEKIITQQMNIEEKRHKADFVINNMGSEAELLAEVEDLLLKIFN